MPLLRSKLRQVPLDLTLAEACQGHPMIPSALTVQFFPKDSGFHERLCSLVKRLSSEAISPISGKRSGEVPVIEVKR